MQRVLCSHGDARKGARRGLAADHQEGHAVRRGWLALAGLVVAAVALYTLLVGVPVGASRDAGQEIGERSRQDLRELLQLNLQSPLLLSSLLLLLLL